MSPPQPFADSSLIEYLETPGGVIRAQSVFYVERPEDNELYSELQKRYGTTTTIRAPRQTGKTSLLIKSVLKARQGNYKIVHIDFQRVGSDVLDTPDAFLYYLARTVVRQLRLNLAEIDHIWNASLPVFERLNYLLEDYIFPASTTPIILALDEMDGLLTTEFHDDFFSMVRFWHNNRVIDEQWNKLNVIMVISTEPHLLIRDVNRSPFNVGQRIKLADFNEQQVSNLNEQYLSPLSPTQVTDLMDLIGGHPYLTQQALYSLVRYNMMWEDFVKVAETDTGPFDDHLQRYLWLLDEQPELTQAMKRVIEHHTCPQREFYRLLQAGLLKGNDNSCTCRCRLYENYFGSRLQ